MRVCRRCGHQNPAYARFCARCSEALDDGGEAGAPAPALEQTLAAGVVLEDRYVVTRQLGRGGMGAVYEVRDNRLGGKRWALKALTSSGMQAGAREEAVRAFAQEATLLAALSHPNLPQVIDYFSVDDRHYLVMEFVEGMSLDAAARTAGAPLPEPRVLGWAMQICAVLRYLHGRQPPIIFRDLKPSNIMLTPEERIRLVDFGIARVFKAGQQTDTASLGTHGYAAPECYGIGQSDARSDIYSLGATLHALLTGYDPSLRPFVFPAARTLRPDLSVALDQIIQRAVQLDPAQRFQRIEDLQQALAAVAVAPPASASPPITVAAGPRCPRCGKPLPPQVRFCGYCGQQLSGSLAPLTAATVAPATPLLCPQCRQPVPLNARFCGHCGTALPDSARSPASQSPQATRQPEVSASVAAATRNISANAQPVRCPRCGHDNPPGRWHCASCGAALPL